MGAVFGLAVASGTYVTMRKYDTNYPGGDGNVLVVTGTYEIP